MRLIINLFFCLSLYINLSLGILHKNSLHASDAESTGAELLKFDFSTLSGDIRQELKDLGFQFEKEMADPNKIELSNSHGRLNIASKKPAFGLLVNKTVHVESAEWVEITWGIETYPDLADWSKGKNQEAIMIYLFFGKPVKGDRFYLPDSPFFIGLFLGRNEAPLVPYKGKSYQQTGRYVCLDNPEPGRPVTSRYRIVQAYRDMFGTSEVPPVTGIAIEVDTSSLSDTTSSAFIQTIRLQGAES